VTTSLSLAITWTAPTLNGGTPVIDYRVSWDQGGSTYTVIISGITTTSYSTTATLTAGTVYKFKVESRNAFGYSTSFSNEISIKAVDPTAPTAPQSLAINAEVTEPFSVGLTWKAPSSNGGRELIDYQINFKIGFGEDGEYAVLAAGITTTSFTANSLTVNVIYNFKV